MAKKKTSTAKPSSSAKPKAGRTATVKPAGASKSGPKAVGKKAATSKKAPRKASRPKASSPKAAPPASKINKKPTSKVAAKPAKKGDTKKVTKKAPASKPAEAPKKNAPAPAAAKTPKKAPAPPEPKGAKKPAKPPKPAEAPKPAPKPAPAPVPEASVNHQPAPPSKDADRKGPPRPKRPKPPVAVMPEGIGGLLAPGGPAPKPLIASTDRKATGDEPTAEVYPTKSPFNKRDLDKFRQILLEKRAQVLAEVTGLEGDALTGGGSGNLSHTPQHMADAGTDAADQTLSLDLAAAERNLIREIDAALQRVDDGVFGLCVATGKPIRKERLAELPWARYSIDAARQMEGRRGS